MENILTLAVNLDKVAVCERKIMWLWFGDSGGVILSFCVGYF